MIGRNSPPKRDSPDYKKVYVVEASRRCYPPDIEILLWDFDSWDMALKWARSIRSEYVRVTITKKFLLK